MNIINLHNKEISNIIRQQHIIKMIRKQAAKLSLIPKNLFEDLKSFP